MTRLFKFFFLLLFLSASFAFGQGNTVTISGSGAPTGSCAFLMRYIDTVGQTEYACDTAGNWFLVGPGAAGATSLNSVTDPTLAKTFSMGANALVWNWTTNSSTTNLFSVADFATNTGTGYLFTISSGSSSATKPFRACYRGTTDCVTLNTTTLSTSGATVIDATKLSGTLPALDGSALTSVNAATLLTKTWASPAAIGTGTPAAGTFTALTSPLLTSAESAVANGSGTTTWNIGVDSTTHQLTCKNSAGSSCIPSGSGTVTVVGGGSLTSTALVTGGGTTTLQTPSATTTLDSSGNLSTPGTISSTTANSGLDITEGTGGALTAAAGHDLLWADSTAHRLKMNPNNSGAVQLVASGVDINTSDQVTATHLASALPMAQGGTGLATNSADTVLQGTGSAWQAAALTNCGDATHAVSYNTTTHAFGCQAITATAAAGGSDTQVQYNNATSLGGITNMTSDGTNAIFTEITAPASPAAGKEVVYAKSGSGLCAKDSGGTERCTGSGGGSAPTFPVNAQTTSYTVLSGDFSSCKYIPVTSSSVATVTLLGTAPTTGQCIMVQNEGTANVVVARNGLTIDGASSDLTLVANQGVTIISDGVNYFTNRGTRSAATFFTSSPSELTSSNAGPGANGYVLSAVYIPQPVLFSNIVVDVVTADNTANRYAVCMYDGSGALVATTGTLPQISASGAIEQATTSANILIPAGRYYFGFTGNAATAKFGTTGVNQWTDMSNGTIVSGGGTTCQSSVTLPSHSSWALGRTFWFSVR